MSSTNRRDEAGQQIRKQNAPSGYDGHLMDHRYKNLPVPRRRGLLRSPTMKDDSSPKHRHLQKYSVRDDDDEASTVHSPASDGEEEQAEEDEMDSEKAEQHQKTLLKLFDTKWQPLQQEDREWYDKVTTFIQAEFHPKDIDKLGLDMEGTDGKTCLFLMISVAGPKPKGQSQAFRLTFPRRRDLFRWLMKKYPTLYQQGREHIGYSVFEHVIQRLIQNRINKEFQENEGTFIEYFLTNYPEEFSTLLNMEGSKEGVNQLALVHQLFSLVKKKKYNLRGARALLKHLDKATVLQKDHAGNTVLHLAVAYEYMSDETEESLADLLAGIQELLCTCEEALRCTNNVGLSPYQYRVKTHDEIKLANATERGPPLANDRIAQYLKDRYMHMDKPSEIIKYLHGDVQEYEIHLNLEELSQINTELKKADLEGLLDTLRLENILQCVRIPKYRLAVPQAKANPPRTGRFTAKSISSIVPSDQQATARRDYEQIFDLLGSRGVRKIIKIKVLDDDQIPHSDEVLERLDRFDIEEWDWDRTDICSEVLVKAAPNLRKVTLYSSGSNAVLRSWSGADGLNKLQKLEEVNVIIYQRLESLARVNTYKDAFLKRMEENKPRDREIKVHAEVKTHARGKGLTRYATCVDGEAKATAWLKTMDNFAKFITNIPEEAYPAGRVSIKVALLDDGIDGVHGGFGRESGLGGGISFLNRDDNVLPYYFSSIGHGTQMAELIRRICPHVQLYVVRLDQYPSADGTRMQPTPESAALGIQWAIRKQVDIISMSWTIAKTESNKYGTAQLEQALQDARKANILMFGASSDQGWNEENAGLPSGSAGVFCIGAAKNSGKAEDLSEKEARYVLPGSSGGNDGRFGVARQGDGQPVSAEGSVNSSSHATALAAGLAALILFCVEFTEKLTAEDVRLLRKFEVMGEILDRMCTENKKYIAVKRYFDPKLAGMSWDQNSQKRFRELVDIIIRPFTDNRRKLV